MPFLEQISRLYEDHLLNPLWARYPKRDVDNWDAIRLFLEGYAFERQGASKEYSHASIDAVGGVKGSELRPTDPSLPFEVWDRFSNLLGGKNLNHANNPICPQGTEYKRTYKGRSYESRTHLPSILQLSVRLALKEGSGNLVLWTRRVLKNCASVAEVYRELCGVNGIGGKIASFWIRDVADSYQVFPGLDRHLLQPVDIWIRRITAYLMEVDSPSDLVIAKWIVDGALRTGTNPEKINQGMWYFGSQICGSMYRVRRAFDDLQYGAALTNIHMDHLRGTLDGTA